jgi:hypothetical protein
MFPGRAARFARIVRRALPDQLGGIRAEVFKPFAASF